MLATPMRIFAGAAFSPVSGVTNPQYQGGQSMREKPMAVAFQRANTRKSCTRHLASAGLAAILVSGTLQAAPPAATDIKVRIDIPAQDLSTALTQFGRDTRTEIVFSPDAVKAK